jgi:hypothetical protein
MKRPLLRSSWSSIPPGRWRTPVRQVVLVAALAGLAACGNLVVPGVPLTGTWGGVHLQANLTESGGTLEYDCAAGTISSALVPDERGRVSVTGIHSPGHGGPVRQDEVPPRLPARYDGVVRGDRLTLTVTLTDTNEQIGTFDLTRGAPGSVFRCL